MKAEFDIEVDRRPTTDRGIQGIICQFPAPQGMDEEGREYLRHPANCYFLIPLQAPDEVLNLQVGERLKLTIEKVPSPSPCN